MTGAFNERAINFGRSASLMGILSRPSAEMPIRGPAVVLLNTGIAHRVGHHRMYVTMARELAALGHIVFRFDFSGIGDSAPRGGTLNPIDAHQADLGEALDWLTTSCDVNEVILVGLCMGAEIALRFGHSDPRVSGLVLLDPEIPPTARFYANYTRRRLMRLNSWLSFFRGRGLVWDGLVARTRSAFRGVASQVESAGRQSIHGELGQLYLRTFERKMNVLIVVAGQSLEGRYRDQLFDAFPDIPLRGWISLEYFDQADHTFTSGNIRSALQALILRWIDALPAPVSPSLPQISSGEVVCAR
ncbi:alpha/beta fold hydrolase [Bradyrhizobium symbiodeficiens]|uniref:alpha/beta fold hydrolase n=1 Tax=Bradyrhizobium symbiodeficiens TaxID=1404367 RepID=UPI0030D2563D